MSLKYNNLISLYFYLRHVIQSTHTCWLMCINISCSHSICIYIIYSIQLSINLISLYFYLQAMPFQTRILYFYLIPNAHGVGWFVSILAVRAPFAYVYASYLYMYMHHICICICIIFAKIATPPKHLHGCFVYIYDVSSDVSASDAACYACMFSNGW